MDWYWCEGGTSQSAGVNKWGMNHLLIQISARVDSATTYRAPTYCAIFAEVEYIRNSISCLRYPSNTMASLHACHSILFLLINYECTSMIHLSTARVMTLPASLWDIEITEESEIAAAMTVMITLNSTSACPGSWWWPSQDVHYLRLKALSRLDPKRTRGI